MRRAFLRASFTKALSLRGQAKSARSWFSSFGKAVYLDMQATTPVDFRVLDAMMPYMTNLYGNPHSRTHEYGWETEKEVEDSRKKVADLINADPKEIIFTSGATESNNMALKGLCGFYGKSKNHLIALQTEHKCILDTCRHLEEQGFEVTYLPVNPNGLVDLATLKASIKPTTLAISCMFANNEIGVIQPMEEIGEICRSHKVFFHTDAAQAFGKIPIDVSKLKVDLMSISSHKIYGPKGLGAIYIRRKPKVRLTRKISNNSALINGGGQERGFRSGTLPSHLIVGFGKACEIAQNEMESDGSHVSFLFDRLRYGLSSKIPAITFNGDMTSRLKNNLNVSFTGVEGESLLMAIKKCAVSSGSACTSSSLEPSYVLRALGVEEDMAHTSLRIGIGRFTTVEEIDYLIDSLESSVARLREISPLWEMIQEGIDLKSIQWSQPH